MCPPKGRVFGPFWSENTLFFEGTTGAYMNGHIYMNKNEIEICKFEMYLEYFFVYALTWGGTGGREPGRTGGGRGTGGGRRKGGRRDLYDGGKRERNSKSQAVFLLLLTPSQRNEPNNIS